MKVAARIVIKARKDYHTLLMLVRQNPGIHYRELFRVSGLGYATFERQVALLERLSLLKAHRAGGFTRYYNSDVSKTDIELLYYLKLRAYQEIIRLLLDDASEGYTFQEIVQMIGKAPSTVSVQPGRLIDHKLVSFDESVATL
jgi:predicted transcriptional regulator